MESLKWQATESSLSSCLLAQSYFLSGMFTFLIVNTSIICLHFCQSKLDTKELELLYMHTIQNFPKLELLHMHTELS